MKNKKLSSIILWSVVSAAFIGPGTITTAVTAGSSYGLDLLWAIFFSAIACLVLQEIAARITIASGKNLGQILTQKFGTRKGRFLKYFIGGSVILGCAAYEAGNILGAVSGLNLLTGMDARMLTIGLVLIAASILWYGQQKIISRVMLFFVIVMGGAFMMLAFSQDFTLTTIAVKTWKPMLPSGAELITLGLVGTTIVPYNLFLGSGISKGQELSFMRLGLSVSVLLGGLITASILIAGTAVGNFSSFENLAAAFENNLGRMGALALAGGLFAAGFSSTITAPFASSIIGATVFGVEGKKRLALIWGAVLLFGFIVGISGIKPIPVILFVQALNGFILPLLVYYLIIIVNSPSIIPIGFRHPKIYNVVLLLILGSVLLMGLNNIAKAIITGFAVQFDQYLLVMIGITLAVMALVSIKIFADKNNS